MTKLDPIIAVKDVETSTKWYQHIFGFKKGHGGSDFSVLLSERDEVVLCLHKWGEHDHPTMQNPNLTPGNGLILYFKTDNLIGIRQQVEANSVQIEEDIHTNPNSNKKEFSFRDPDGYFLTVTEFHKYEG